MTANFDRLADIREELRRARDRLAYWQSKAEDHPERRRRIKAYKAEVERIKRTREKHLRAIGEKP
jgi:hypothetical protein